ncbi:MAG TPA: hypothetical protein VNJ07_05265, partial [Chitinophagales bacterium]|nr:hypothetical protein [Chitinophagales bacterium]
RHEINKLKEAVAHRQQTIQDFGTVTMNDTELWIPFSEDFKKNMSAGSTPVIALTPNQFVQLIISEKNESGFRVRAASSVKNLNIDWLAVMKTTTQPETSQDIGTSLPPELKNQLKVPEEEKQKLMNYWNRQMAEIETRGKAE